MAMGGDAITKEALPADAVPWASLAAPPALGGAMVQGSGGGPTIEYYALDALGSVRVVFDAAGNVKARADYEPFGAPVTSSTTGPLPREQFTGQQRDSEVGLDYFGARFYHATHGRMLSVDPLYLGAVGDPQRWNRYAYALNSPVVMIDPDGRVACTGTGSGQGFVGSCGSGSAPAVNTPSPGQPPLLGNFGVGGDAYDYFDVNYGPGYRPDPLGGVRVGGPVPTTTTTTTEVGEQIIEAGGGIITLPSPRPQPPPGNLPKIVQMLAPVLARIQGQAAMLAARILGTSPAGAPQLSVTFGRNANQIEHAFRHTDKLGLSRTAVQGAVQKHLPSVADRIPSGASLTQVIEVGGTRIQYSAYRFLDGSINVGRIHGVP